MRNVVRRMARSTRNFSARWAGEVLDRLQHRSEVAGTSKSRLAERYVDEGIRRDEHPGIEFRDGPTGRRAALPRGPDVWQLVATLNEFGPDEEKAIAPTADLLNLDESQVRAGVAYYTAFPDEVNERIALNVEGADEAEAAWLRDQAALA
jgi:hypothetical protein